MNLPALYAIPCLVAGLAVAGLAQRAADRHYAAPEPPAPTSRELHQKAVAWSRLAAYYELRAGLVGLRERKQQRAEFQAEGAAERHAAAVKRGAAGRGTCKRRGGSRYYARLARGHVVTAEHRAAVAAATRLYWSRVRSGEVTRAAWGSKGGRRKAGKT
jgi:hypothetical protein